MAKLEDDIERIRVVILNVGYDRVLGVACLIEEMGMPRFVAAFRKVAIRLKKRSPPLKGLQARAIAKEFHKLVRKLKADGCKYGWAQKAARKMAGGHAPWGIKYSYEQIRTVGRNYPPK